MKKAHVDKFKESQRGNVNEETQEVVMERQKKKPTCRSKESMKENEGVVSAPRLRIKTTRLVGNTMQTSSRDAGTGGPLGTMNTH